MNNDRESVIRASAVQTALRNTIAQQLVTDGHTAEDAANVHVAMPTQFHGSFVIDVSVFGVEVGSVMYDGVNDSVTTIERPGLAEVLAEAGIA